MFNKNYYPTPKNLISKMWNKINKVYNVTTILEPSAGKGDIVEYIQDQRYRRSYEISCIEKDENLQALLKGKKIKVIDSDFLEYSGLDKYDLIIANPPFDEGDKHLLKAIDIMYSGEIVFLLNAETIKNPYTNTRKLLVRKLEELDADIEFIEQAFKDAERKTNVEVAIIHIAIVRDIEHDLLNDCHDQSPDHTIDTEDKQEISSTNTIEHIVQSFNATVRSCIKMIEHFYKNRKYHGEFLKLSTSDESHFSGKNIQEEINIKINQVLINIRKSYWSKILELKEVKSRMTEKVRSDFYDQLKQQAYMDFTEYNIRSFILTLIGNYDNILGKAVDEVFDKMSHKHHWYDEMSKNIHYYNGWKTNKAHYVNKKVILPMYASYGHPFIDWGDRWKLDYKVERKLNDIDTVMNNFHGASNYLSISKALEKAFEKGQTRNVESTFFKISIFKKGTIHLTFLDENIRRRFNVTAGKNKKWLWEDYGERRYNELTQEEKSIVESFEGKEVYENNIGQIGFVKQDLNLLEAS